MKKIIIALWTVIVIGLICPNLYAKMGSGKVTAKSEDVNIEIFGALQSFPTFINDPDFNDDQTNWDYVMFEDGFCGEDDVSVRTEARVGFQGYGENWTFYTILESQFVMSKTETDGPADLVLMILV